MSHEITNNDKQQGIEMGWHGLTEVLKEIILRTCWLMQWDVIPSPMFEADGSASEWCRLVCTDNKSLRIGTPVHCESYSILSNAAFVALVENSLKDIKGAKVASVGSVCNRSRIFISVKLTELEVFKVAGREFLPYLNFISSHDKSAPFVVNTSNVCTVCNNTFRANLHYNGKGVKSVVRHTKNMADKLENIPEVIAGFLGAQAEFKAQMEIFANEPIKVDDANPLFVGFLAGKTPSVKEKLSTRSLNQANRLTELFTRGAGNRGENMADAFSAITDYYSHESSGGDDNRLKQWESSEYGDGTVQKSRAFELFGDRAKVKELIVNGQKLLATV